jgi:hypothetical protein
MNLFVVVEGDGDHDALPVLIAKLAGVLGLSNLPHIARNRGASVAPLNADKPRGRARVEARCEIYRARPGVCALLLTQDSEDSCPKDLAPEIASWIRPLDLPFPVAVVLFYREYETMFLAASGTLRGKELKGQVGRTGLPTSAVYHGDPEARRDAKGWLGEQLGRRYTETIDQEAFTRTLDFTDPVLGNLSSFRRLGSALKFLATHAGSGKSGIAYP